jgi:putative acetyltransferase
VTLHEPAAIRVATEDDVTEIRRVIRSAILGLASRDYPAEVLENWGVNSAAAINRQQQAIRESRELTWVAVTANTIVGFSALDPQQCVVRAVYVAAEAARSGIGTRLLAAVEDMARALGIERLTLDSSVNAEPFYRHHGYVSLGECMHVLGTGVPMRAVRMEKILTGSGGITGLGTGRLP